MHRIDGAGHVGHMFVTEDAPTSRPPTEVTADWLNAIQEEICNFIESTGTVLNKFSNNQLLSVLTGGFQASMTTNGFVRLPLWLSGAMVQWGYVTCGGFGSTNFPFNVAFPNQVFGVGALWARSTYPGDSKNNPLSAYTVDLAHGVIENSGSSGVETCFYFAIGR
ncbi:gp53-like domain-containing protein [Methylomonas sp. MS20]|uniref:gp53-like domain-containing protein n=1 Tax=unclassified Methylomonas TaxID=2608980 RepID=UPI0028A44182|nr:hypothetical protein [Methylomonas sp. MV1]MDT4328552.1 hypothetical protein [Methylomonas sp. MV1]